MAIYLSKENRVLLSFLLFLLLFLNPLIASNLKEQYKIDLLVRSCYKNIDTCNYSLLKINKYQKDAAKNKKFSCQTRLLGLEANLIMAKNSNFKSKEAKSIIEAIKKYC